jgi:hypothetical protein
VKTLSPEADLLRSAAEALDSSIRSVPWDDDCDLQKMWRRKYEDIAAYMVANGYRPLRPWPEESRRALTGKTTTVSWVQGVMNMHDRRMRGEAW